MSKFKTPDGILVSVADEMDPILAGLYYSKVGGGSTRSKHSDDPTPSGSIRKPHVDPTPSAQIRAQRAADPFSG